MDPEKDLRKKIYEGLKALNKDMFPKVCGTCGEVFHSADDYVRKTRRLFRASGFQHRRLQEGGLLELYRNCRCGSTLLALFENRRDTTEMGQRRREQFQRILDQMVSMGWDRSIAREEVDRILSGQSSSLLELFLSR